MVMYVIYSPHSSQTEATHSDMKRLVAQSEMSIKYIKSFMSWSQQKLCTHVEEKWHTQKFEVGKDDFSCVCR